MPTIERIHARQILDSRGNPTVEVEVALDSQARGRPAVPSGASTGEFEATQQRVAGEAWNGKGVAQAVSNVNSDIAEALIGARATDQGAIDRTLMPIEGCLGLPDVQVGNIRLSKKRFRAGGSIYGSRTIIAWWASEPVEHTDIRIELRVRGAWRLLGVLVGTGTAGDNSVHWDGRLKGRKLKPGRYGLRIQPVGSEPTKLVRFRIVRRR